MIYIYLVIALLLLYLNWVKGKQLFNYCLFYRGGYQAIKRTILSYGYQYDIKHHIMMSSFMVVLIVIACLLFEVRFESILVVLVLSSMLLPMLYLWISYHSYQEKVFNDFTMFLQNFIALFKLNPKTFHVLGECYKLVDGELAISVKLMMETLETGGNIKKCFKELTKINSHFIVFNLCSLVSTIENHGGTQFLDGLDLIQDDIDDWIEDTYTFKKAQVSLKNRMIGLCALSTIIAIFAKNMLGEIEFNTEGNLYQIAILIFLITLLVTLTMAHRTISQPWVEEEECICSKSS